MADWNPSDYDPEVEAAHGRRSEDLAARVLGVDRDTVNAWIRAEWIRFEARLREWSGKRWSEAGVNVSDADKAAHRRRFHARLRGVYGRSLPDQAWTNELEARLTKQGRAA